MNNICIPNTLIDLGTSISAMTRETMEKLKLTNLHQNFIVLQMVDLSIVEPKSILDDNVIFVESWEHPSNLIVLQTKSNLGGYPLILGRPWLAIVDACINCISRDMTISYGNATKKLTLYPPTKPSFNHEIPLWDQNEDNDEENFQQLIMDDLALAFKEKYDDDLICDAMA